MKRFFDRLLKLAGATLLFAVSGCSAVTSQSLPDMEGPLPEHLAGRMEDFRSQLINEPRRSVLITQKSLKQLRRKNIDASRLAGQLNAFGFNRLIIEVRSVQDFGKGSAEESQLMELIRDCRDRNIDCAFFLRERDGYLPAGTGHWFYSPSRDFFGEFAREINEFNCRLPAGRIGELVVRLDTSSFTTRDLLRPQGMRYVWSAQGFGVGGENDKLLQKSLHAIAQAKAAAPQLQLTLMIPAWLHDEGVNQKRLSGADVNSLLSVFDHLLINPERSPDAAAVLQDAVKSASCEVCIALNDREGAAAFSNRQTWEDFMSGMGGLSTMFLKHGSYCGMVLFSYDDFILQWESI